MLLQTLGAAVLCGLVWEAIRKLRARRKKVLPGKSVSQSVSRSFSQIVFIQQLNLEIATSVDCGRLINQSLSQPFDLSVDQYKDHTIN